MSWGYGLRILISLALASQVGLDREGFWHWVCWDVFNGPRRLQAAFLPLASALWIVVEISLMSLIYWMELPWLESRRSYPPGVPFPWKDPRPEVRAEYERQKWRTFKQLLVNVVLINFTSILLRWNSEPNLQLLLPETIPSRIAAVAQLYVVILVSTFGLYWYHRAFHSRWLYRWHKQHHEFISPTVLAPTHMNPVEAIVVGVFISFIYWALSVHMYVQMIHFLLANLDGVCDHCGYELDLCILPFEPGMTRAAHDVHHRVSVNHNFGTMGIKIWDELFGTYMDPRVGRGDQESASPVQERLPEIMVHNGKES